ncbi:YlzJ-like family protein [Aeribacillus sp. FSL W8-0870]|uniref:YlzJ-like family protein n=1 Tax=Aeribacillus sp. FSL W8-0870 TaxID=2954706 RepID=UPI0030D60520
MILYTTVPEELIFPSDQEAFQKRHIVEMNGISLLIEETGENQCQIVRVLSTNPNHYLLESVFPGQKVPFFRS